MRIAIDVTGSLYEGTGVATYYTNLVPRLLEISEGEHEFVPFGYSLRRREDLRLASKTFPFPPRLMEILWNKLHVLPVEALLGKLDILHAWDYIQPPTRRAKLVTTIHDLTPLKYPEYQHPRTISAYKEGMRWIKKSASAIIVDSIATKDDVVSLLKIPENMIYVIYLAAPQEFHDFPKRNANTGGLLASQVLKLYALEGNYLLTVGTQEPRKNLDRVIKAHDIIDSEHPLVIIGGYGWGEKLKPPGNVRILGLVPSADLPALYSQASCLVYPSLYEGFGLPVLEAMAVGCPVVTSDRGSLKEIAGDAAVTVNPESVEAIAFGIKVAVERGKELAEKGFLQAAKFSWELTATQTLKVYELLGQ